MAQKIKNKRGIVGGLGILGQAELAVNEECQLLEIDSFSKISLTEGMLFQEEGEALAQWV